MSDFGFEDIEIDTGSGNENEIDWKEETQERVSNILNIDKGLFAGEGPYDIPILKPVYPKEIEGIEEWIPFNMVLSDKNPENKGVHFFIDDYQFARIWNNPERYVDKLKQYRAVLTPDFSPYCDMPMATQIFNHFRKHWVGAYLQRQGITVIGTVRASTDERSLDWYLDGEPHGGVIAISSMWTNDKESLEYFKREYNTMFETLKPKKVLLYGKMPCELQGNIELIETNGRKLFKDKTKE